MKITITQHIKEVLLGSGILVMFSAGLYFLAIISRSLFSTKIHLHEGSNQSFRSGKKIPYRLCFVHLSLLQLALFPSLTPVSAQEATFTRLTTEDGLPSNIIETILQDHRGYLWFGTWFGEGLVRYDGYEMKVFQHVEGDSTSLSAGIVWDLFESRDGTLWVGTEEGLSRFDAATETFTVFRHIDGDLTSLSDNRVRALQETNNGTLWVGTNSGLNRFDAASATFEAFRHAEDDPTSLSHDQINALHESADGALWVGTDGGGLNRLDAESGTFKVYRHIEGDPTSLSDDEVHALHESADGALWVGTDGGGLNRLDAESGTFKVYRQIEGDPTSLNHDQVWSLHQTDDGTLWIGTWGGGLSRLDAATETFEAFRPVAGDPTSLSHRQVRTIYQSDDGVLWAGTWGGGLNRFDAATETFEVHRHEEDDPTSLSSDQVYALHESEDGTLWIGLWGGGLNRFDAAAGMVEVYRYREGDAASDVSEDNVISIQEAENGALWFGTAGGGVYHFDTVSETVTVYRHAEGDTTSLSDDWVNALLVSKDGTLWAGTGEGLSRFDAATETFKVYRHAEGNPTSLNSDQVSALHESEDGTLWVGTRSGLNRYDSNTDSFTRYRLAQNDSTSLSHNNVRAILEADDGTLWVGTRGGLNRLEEDPINSTTVSFTRFLAEAGIRVASLLEDDHGQLWISTDSGRLIRFDPETGQARSFGKRYGLPAGSFTHNALQRRTGDLYWGNTSGLVSLRLDRLPTPGMPPKVHLTALWLFDEPLTPGPDSPLKQALWQTESLRMSHTQNDLTFGFVGLHYANPTENRYQYRLLGYDSDWRSQTTQRKATYTNLPPGSYTFEVKAANSDGIWTEEPVRLVVEIMPPWWRTSWAYGLYGLLFLGMVFIADRMQRRRVIAKERQKARERELEQAREIEKAYKNLEVAHEDLKAAQDQLVQQEKLASLGQLTAGIAHEIKNPLNFVNNFSDLSIELVEEARDEVKASMKSPFEGGSEQSEQGVDPGSDYETESRSSNTPLNPLSRGETVSSSDKTLILDILNDIEINLRKIHKHGSRADGIVKSMLQHSRGGSGKMEPTDVNALIKEYANLAFHGMRAGNDPINVDIELDLDENVGEVEMIAEDFSRVILNLCNNAFDAMREKLSAVSNQQSADSPFEGGSGDGSLGQYEPKLSIRTHKKDQSVTIEIEDNGPGIPKEMMDKIMQPFFTTKKGTQGTGLGLSITNDIIKAHGGELKVQTKEGAGSALIIQLPMRTGEL